VKIDCCRRRNLVFILIEDRARSSSLKECVSSDRFVDGVRLEEGCDGTTGRWEYGQAMMIIAALTSIDAVPHELDHGNNVDCNMVHSYVSSTSSTTCARNGRLCAVVIHSDPRESCKPNAKAIAVVINRAYPITFVKSE
jgi:hypothetical protein